VRERCEEMKQTAEDAAVQIRNEYSIQLMLIKKDVRSHPDAPLPHPPLSSRVTWHTCLAARDAQCVSSP